MIVFSLIREILTFNKINKRRGLKFNEMKKYFYSDGKEKHGPLTIDELKQKDISKETLVWFEGLYGWKLAGDLDDMKPILELQPPPIFTNEKNDTIEPELNKYGYNPKG